jgi:hypothetical protein
MAPLVTAIRPRREDDQERTGDEFVFDDRQPTLAALVNVFQRELDRGSGTGLARPDLSASAASCNCPPSASSVRAASSSAGPAPAANLPWLSAKSPDRPATRARPVRTSRPAAANPEPTWDAVLCAGSPNNASPRFSTWPTCGTDAATDRHQVSSPAPGPRTQIPTPAMTVRRRGHLRPLPVAPMAGRRGCPHECLCVAT